VHNSFPGHGTNVITCLQFDRDKIISASDDNCINVYHTATGKIKKRLEGHEGGVWALQYRGDTLVTGSTDRSVRVWCLKTMRLTHTFTGHTSTVRCLTIVEPVLDEKTGKYFPPYPLIVTGSRDASLRVWKLPQRGEPNVVKWVGPHLQRGEADMLGSQCKRRKRVIARITRREPISSLCVDWTYRCDSSLGL
jgi:F-box and WD-40 domain protein CDC4